MTRMMITKMPMIVPMRPLLMIDSFSRGVGWGSGQTVVRVRERPVTAEAIMTSTAATTIAMIQRTQSMPGLPFPPNAV